MLFGKFDSLLIRARKINTMRFSYSTVKGEESKSLPFNSDEFEKIMEIVNKSSLDELLKYRISKSRAMGLLSWRQSRGEINNLNDLLIICSMDMRALKALCISILPKKPKENLERKVTSFTIPKLSKNHRHKIRSTTALHIGVGSITWSRLELCGDSQINNSNIFTHWEHHDFKDTKTHISNLVDRCLYYGQLIPTADCYILENPKLAQVNANPGSVERQNINIQGAQMTAMISLVLAARRKSSSLDNTDPMEKDQQEVMEEEIVTKKDSEIHNVDVNDDKILQLHNKEHLVESKVERKNQEKEVNVFYLRRLLTARLFNRLVGNEGVSTEQLIFNLMRSHNTLSHTDQSFLESCGLHECLQFSPEFCVMFSRARRFQREFLGQALLLNIAFQRLVLLQDENSILKVSNTNKRKMES